MSVSTRQNSPIISNSLATIAFIIHAGISLLSQRFHALVEYGYLYQSQINDIILAIMHPPILAGVLAPFVCMVRSTSYWQEFRNMLFLTISASMTISLLEMTGWPK